MHAEPQTTSKTFGSLTPNTNPKIITPTMPSANKPVPSRTCMPEVSCLCDGLPTLLSRHNMCLASTCTARSATNNCASGPRCSTRSGRNFSHRAIRNASPHEATGGPAGLHRPRPNCAMDPTINDLPNMCSPRPHTVHESTGATMCPMLTSGSPGWVLGDQPGPLGVEGV